MKWRNRGSTYDQSQEVVEDRNGTGNDPGNKPQPNQDGDPKHVCLSPVGVQKILSLLGDFDEDVFLANDQPALSGLF